MWHQTDGGQIGDEEPSVVSPSISEKTNTITKRQQSDDDLTNGPSPSPIPKQPVTTNVGDQEQNQQQICLNATTSNEESRRRSASRASSLGVDDPKSLIDSLSASSGRHNWSAKENADDDPSISSIKGDSVSATIADYNRKHHHSQQQTLDEMSRSSGAQLGANEGENSNAKVTGGHDDQASNINFYAPGESTSSIVNNQMTSSAKPCPDFMSVSSNANMDAFDIIEESGNLSSCENLAQIATTINAASHHLHHHQHHHHHNHSRGRNDHKRHHKSHRHYRTQSSSIDQPFLEVDDLPQEVSIYQIEPIILRGNGNLTLFGLSNSFSAEFPSALIGRVSKEEFNRTMTRVNSLLRDHQSLSAKLLLLGGLCCCCSLGFSLVWPSIALKRRSKLSLEKYLASENSRLYSKLGLNWKLAEQRCYSNHAFVEYVLMIEFTPKINLYLPD